MNAPTSMERVIGRKKYSTSTATLLADDNWWDGSNFERHGRNQFLYRAPGGAYFVVTLSQWQGEKDTLEPVDLDAAIALYEGPLQHSQYVDFAEAFPGVEVEEA